MHTKCKFLSKRKKKWLESNEIKTMNLLNMCGASRAAGAGSVGPSAGKKALGPAGPANVAPTMAAASRGSSLTSHQFDQTLAARTPDPFLPAKSLIEQLKHNHHLPLCPKWS